LTLGVAAAVCLAGVWMTVGAASGYGQFVGSYHDDAIYVVCAKALAAGLGYRIISLPMEPWQTKYPPLFPLSLATVFVVSPTFPGNTPLLTGLSCAYGVGFALAACAWLTISGRATPLLGLSVLAFTWLNLNFLSFIPVPMAEMECAALAVFGLWLTETAQVRSRQAGETTWRQTLPRFLLAPVVLAASALTHTMGIFALAAAGIYLVLQKNLRALAVVSALSAAIVLPLWIWAGLNSYTSPPTLVYYTNYLLAARSTAAQGALPVFVAKNIASGFTEVMDTTVQALKHLPDLAASRPLEAIIYGALWAAVLAGLAREATRRRGHELLAIWISIHGLAHLLWPRGVGMRRLLVALPFIYYLLFMGGRAAGKAVKPLIKRAVARGRYATICAITAVGFAALLIGGDLVEDSRWLGRYAYRVPPPAKAGKDYTESSEFAEAYRWIEGNTAPEAVLVWNNDPAAYLWTGRHAVAASIGESFGVSVYPDALITSDDLLSSLKLVGGDYLVIDPISVGGMVGFNQIGMAVEALMKEHPGLVTHAFTTRYGLITVFKVDRRLLK